jgi:hypothetical protein
MATATTANPLTEAEYAARYSVSLDGYAMTRKRSLQAGIGVSDVGFCREQARRVIAGMPETDSPSLRAAEAGQAHHDYAEKARAWDRPDLIHNHKLEIFLPSGRLMIPGTADEIDPTEPSVTDLKTKATRRELLLVRRSGASEKERFQRHLYYLGAVQAGLVPHEGIVRNIWMSRAGDTEEMVVEQEPFDMAVVHEADEWLGGVLYAAKHGEEAPRDIHAARCREICPFYTDCRGGRDEDIVVTDPYLVEAGHIYANYHRLSQENDLIAQGAREALIPLQGHDPRYEIPVEDGVLGWVRVNTDPPTYRLELRKA